MLWDSNPEYGIDSRAQPPIGRQSMGTENLDKFHGQVTGIFTGDEHFSGKNPPRTELCAVVEHVLIRAFSRYPGIRVLADGWKNCL